MMISIYRTPSIDQSSHNFSPSFVLFTSLQSLFLQCVRRPAPESTPFCMASLKGLLAPRLFAPPEPATFDGIEMLPVRAAGLVICYVGAPDYIVAVCMFPVLPWVLAILAASAKLLFAAPEAPAGPLALGDIREKRVDLRPPAVVKPN